ncbi:profilin-1 [Brienomyrus brachyistius]|uniref:profilin-1 n=1 Tax=Brienomyrus brachyistius TaxID=42636 RepID=UPI0020B35415|nr:profilin-1 [Brienomyrus brachyistius]
MSWDGYITNLMAGDFMMDAAIVGHEKGQESVWAAHKGGDLARISAAEIRQLVTTDRGSLFSTGVTIAGTKCTVLRDALNIDGQSTMDVRTKASDQNPDTYNISIGKSGKALVFVKGNKEAHGGKLNPKAFDMSQHLKKSGY